MPKPGTIITDIAGFDVGSGAIVLSWKKNIARLYLQDTGKTVRLRIPEGVEVSTEEFEPTGPADSVIDPSVPKDIDNITGLPLYWGPRDPNYPSSLTDTSYRPQQWWNRMLGRWAKYLKPLGKSANKESTMLTVACNQINPQSKIMQTMRLDRWTPEQEKAACLDKETLMNLAVQCWDEYEHVRMRSHPRFGRGWNTRIEDFIVFFVAPGEANLDHEERDCFLDFLVAVGLLQEAERCAVKTLQSADISQVMRSEIPRIK